MPGQGPPPQTHRARKRDEERREAQTVTRAQSKADELHGEPLPAGILPNSEPWHPQTLALWRALRRDPFTAEETELGWQFLIDTALMHHTMWTKGKWEFAAEIRLRLAKFGATPEDRKRLQRKVTTTKDESNDVPDAPTEEKQSRRGQLKIV